MDILSFRKISASLPQTVDTASQCKKAAFALLSTETSQDLKLLIKMCLREIVIKRKKSPKPKRQKSQNNHVVMIHANKSALLYTTL